jgi:hypothetical protein
MWCRFSEDLRLTPGRKPRPALVLTVFDDAAPEYRVRVVYGTSQKTDRLYAGEFRIAVTDGDAYRLSGLSYTTKFNLKRSVELPYNEEWFGVPPGAPHGQVPRLGVLHPSLLPRVQAAWAGVRDR